MLSQPSLIENNDTRFSRYQKKYAHIFALYGLYVFSIVTCGAFILNKNEPCYEQIKSDCDNLTIWWIVFICISVYWFCVTSFIGWITAEFPDSKVPYVIHFVNFASLLSWTILGTIWINNISTDKQYPKDLYHSIIVYLSFSYLIILFILINTIKRIVKYCYDSR
jgi:hypothetical protein